MSWKNEAPSRARRGGTKAEHTAVGSVRRPAPGGGTITAQGHPRAVFRRAVERKNLLVAEMTAREIGVITLDEALALVCLAAEAAPERLDPSKSAVKRV